MMKIVIFISRGLLTIVFAMTFFTNSFSQGFNVKEFKQIINDGSAFHAPMDEDGHPCGLIKVRTDDASLKFKGNVVGEVENKTNEYWIYIPQGCRSLLIMHPNFLPLSVDFSAYGVVIVPKATYILTLNDQKFKKEKCGLIATVKPETACLYINDELVENLSGNGYYQLFLPKGDHICRIEQKGYRPQVQAVTIGKGTQILNVELESVMAELTVKCKTATAEIFIDEELKGNGQWSGRLFPGEHQVEAKQNNFISKLEVISLLEKEERTLTIPELKRSLCQIRIDTKPSKVPIILDGKEIGISPCVIEVETGVHYAECKGYGLIPTRSEIEGISGETRSTTIELQFKEGYMKEYYIRAYNGDLDAILWIAAEKNGHFYDALESVFWLERHPKKDDLLKNWYKYNRYSDDHNYTFLNYFSPRCDWIQAYCESGMPEKILELLPYIKKDAELYGTYGFNECDFFCHIGNGFLKAQNYDKAKLYLEKAGEKGYEGLGDYYRIKNNKQLAASYYNKFLNTNPYEGKSRVLKKLKEIGY